MRRINCSEFPDDSNLDLAFRFFDTAESLFCLIHKINLEQLEDITLSLARQGEMIYIPDDERWYKNPN